MVEIKDQKDLNRLVFAVVSALGAAEEKTYTTTIQKVVYFTLALRDNEGEWFRPYLHGPFSENVAYGLELMVGPYLNVKAEPESDGRLYSIVQEAERKLDSGVRKQINAFMEEASQLIEKLREENLLTPTRIAKLAKVHWLMKHYPEKSPEFLVARALMMAWDLTIEDVKQNLRHLEKLELLGKEISG